MSTRGSQVVNAALVVAALGSALGVWLTRGSVTTGERAARAAELLPVWRAEDVSRLEIDAEGVPLVLVREADAGAAQRFRLERPVQEPASSEAVDKLLEALGSARPVRRLEPVPNAHELGLDTPHLTLTLSMGELSYRLSVGKLAASPAGARYARLQGPGREAASDVLLGAELLGLLEQGPDAFRGRALCSLGARETSRIEFESAGRRVTLVRRKGPSFYLEDSGRRVDRDRIDSLFFQLSHLELSQFLPLAAAERALGSASSRISLTPSDAARPKLVLEIGGACPAEPGQTVVVRRAPDVRAGCAESALASWLSAPSAELLDRRVFALHADEVEELELERGGQRFDLARKDKSFVLRKPRQSDVPLAAGNQRLQDLTQADAELVDDPALAARVAQAPDRATLHAAAGSEAEAETESVHLLAEASGGLLALRDDGALLRLDRDAARAFQVDSTLLRTSELMAFGASSFISAELEGAMGHERLVRSADGQLHLELPAGFTHDGALSVDLVQALGALSAERWVADADDGSFGLAAPELRVDVRYKPGDGGLVRHSLRVGSLTPGGAFASLDDDPAVFLLSRSVLEKLQTSLINRSDFPTDPKLVTRIRIVGASRTLVLERHGAGFVAPGSSLSDGEVAAIVDALGVLQPEAAIHTGPPRPNEGLDPARARIELELGPGAPTKRIRIGSGDVWRSTSIDYARLDGVDATFVVAQSRLRPLLDAIE